VLFWGACAVAFLVLALGPVLHVMGETSFTSYGIVITLPYALLREIIPFLNNSQTPSRLDVIAILSFAVLSGYGLSTLLSRVCGKNGRTVTACLLIVLLLFEFQSMPAISRIDQPAFYREAGDDDGTYALLEIPATANYACGLYCEYYQTISNKPIVGGQIARRPADIFIFEKNTPVINELTFLEPMPDILIQNESLIGTSVFNYYNIKYIIVHTNFLDDQQVEFLENKINGALQFEVMAYPEDHIIVYRILNDTNPDTFMALRDGWYSLEAWNGVPGRWMANNSRLDIVCSESGIYQLSFEAGSVNKESVLLVYVNDALVQAYKIDEMEWNETTPGRVMVNITLNEGKNVIKFHDTRPGIVPSEHNLWNDDRVLNIAVQNISLHRE
jgi:hypothetical protein